MSISSTQKDLSNANDLLGVASDLSTLNAGSGDDTLIGGVGNDRLNGEQGSDTYIFHKGHGQDIIYDYEHTANNQTRPQDKIVFGDVASTEVQVSIVGHDLVLSGYHEDDSIVIKNHKHGTNHQIEMFEFSDKTMNVESLITQQSLLPVI